MIAPVTLDKVPCLVRVPLPEDDKYSRGVLGMVTGSKMYPGAALLGVTAAVHTGVGMVRYIGPSQVSWMVVQARPEVVLGPGPATALVIGSGFPEMERGQLADIVAFADPNTPAVWDAAAMSHRGLLTGPAIITPHLRELGRLSDSLGVPEGDPAERARIVADTLEATVLLKGHQTRVISPGGVESVLPEAPTWLATAGTGDVLAGIVGAVLAGVQARHPGQTLAADQIHDVAVFGALIHREAAVSASSLVVSGKTPVTALGLAQETTSVVARLLA